MSAGNGLLKMSELAERSGVSAGPLKAYPRGGPRAGRGRASGQMGPHPPGCVGRLELIQPPQEKRV